MPAPVGGLNLLATPTAMKSNEALVMDNWFPEPYRVTLRGGYSSHKTGFASTVESLIPFHGGTGTNKLFAAAGTAIYDATSAGAIGAAVVSTLTNARWQYVQFSAGGGDYVVLVNGADGVRTYEGTTWATQTITGATAANFVDVVSHKSRLWFTSNNDTTAYYLASGAISGAASALDLGPVFRMGGVIAFIVPVSFNAGSGFDDGLAFVSTEGEVALYIGTDPSSANTWALQGIFRIGRPLRQRGYTRLAGDALVLTSDGLVSLLAAMRVDRGTSPHTEVSYKIDPVLTQEIIEHGSRFGWSMIVYPKGTRMMVNTPQSTTTFYQWTMNTITNSWCRFKGMNARCWGLLGDSIYFGTGDTVFLADSGTSDNGMNISSDLKWAFSALGAQGLKRVTMLRPHILASGSPAVSVGVDVDFSDIAPTDVPVGPAVISAGIWDTSTWDSGIWGGGTNLIRQWALAGGLGMWVAPRIATNARGYELHVNAVDIMYEPAGRAVIG
jgi:hypothetical protein